MGKEYLSTWEIVCTLSLVTLTPVLISFPQYSSREFGTAAVLHSVYLAIVVFIFYWIVMKLYEPFSGKDIMDIAEFVGGKPLKIMMRLAVILYTLIMMIFTMQEFGEDIKDVMFEHSTNAEINILFTIGMAFLCYFGIRGVFRLGTYLFPAIVIGFVLMFYTLSPKIDFLNLTPILGTGVNNVFLKGLTHVGIYNSLSIMLVIAPLAKKFKKATLLIRLIHFFITGKKQHKNVSYIQTLKTWSENHEFRRKNKTTQTREKFITRKIRRIIKCS
mgnify:CR=1 FL=1